MRTAAEVERLHEAALRQPGATRRLTFPLTPRRRVCEVDFSISPTRRPVDFPKLKNPDTRALGLHFDSYAYVPPK